MTQSGQDNSLVAPSPAFSDYIFLSNNSLEILNLLLPLSRTIMDSSAKEITSVLPDFTLSAPLRLPCCSEMILAQFQVAGVNLFRRFLMQTKFRAFILLD